MRKLAGLQGVAVMLLLMGCSSAPTPAVTVTVTPPPQPVAIPTTAPQCSSLVGHSTSSVMVDGSPYCITGSTAATDKTGFITTNCDPVSNTSTPVYGWYSTDRTARDLQVYAAKQGGVVVIVPDGDAFIRDLGGVAIASYLAAVGCP